MAIYSLSMRSIGRTTHRPHTAAAALRYITRSKACSEALSVNMPSIDVGDSRDAQTWIREQEDGDRRNARVADRIVIALPVELTHDQAVATARAFMVELGGGRIPWAAGIHDKGKDAHNPHAHVLVRDRDRDTGKRVIELTEKGAADRVRELWSKVANEALRAAGSTERIDHRSNADRGIEAIPGIHEGAARHADMLPAEDNRMSDNAKIKRANAALDENQQLRENALHDDLALGGAGILIRKDRARISTLERENALLMRHNAELGQALADFKATVKSQTQHLTQHLIRDFRRILECLTSLQEPRPEDRPDWIETTLWAGVVGHIRQVRSMLAKAIPGWSGGPVPRRKLNREDER